MQVVPRTRGRAPILVVDDDPKIVHLVRMYLEREGFDVVAAADGVSAIAAIRERAPRLLVLDVMLPGLDGFSVFRAARADSDVPVLILSERCYTADRMFGIASCSVDFLPMPFLPGQFLVRVKA